MPTYTVAGRLSADEMRLVVTGTYRGVRPDKVPDGGWGHVVKNARSRRHARKIAQTTFVDYTDGMLTYTLEFETVQVGNRPWWPWSRRKQAAPPVHHGRLPIV